MQIFRHLTINDIILEEFPFKRELSMAAYLIDNEKVLNLDTDTFCNIEIIDTELTLSMGRKSKDTDGRIDILATYSKEYIAIVELKLGELNEIHLKQLEDYLEEKSRILDKYPDIIGKEITPNPKWIGVLVGNSIESNLSDKVRKGYFTQDGTQIVALTIRRFRGNDNSIIVATDPHFINLNSTRDTTKYSFQDEKYGKGRLVLAVLKDYCQKNPNITFSELENVFPKHLQGSKGVFSTLEEANQIRASSGRKRHFLEPEELIATLDSTIAVSDQWGIGNISKFIERAKSQGYKIN